MIVLGVDPGVYESAFCLLDYDPQRARGRWILAGFVEASPRAVEAMLVSLEAKLIELVVVERPVSFGLKNMNPRYLIHTAWAGGTWVGGAQARRLRVTEMTSVEWRGAICGRQSGGGVAGDALVSEVIRTRCTDIPRQTNSHTRDACGVAITGALMHPEGRLLPLERSTKKTKARAA